MREIKFKRYHFDFEGRLIAVTEWGYLDNGFGFTSPAHVNGEDTRKVKDCQFTGLPDKAGKEIYEGDIICSLYSDGKPCRHIIEFDKDRARFAAKYLDYISYTHEIASGINQDWLIRQEKEVIGNIYETPIPTEGKEKQKT